MKQLVYFNSIKVQFEQDVSTAEKVYDANFNSIKVQFEQVAAPTLTGAPEFQFHKGTI